MVLQLSKTFLPESHCRPRVWSMVLEPFQPGTAEQNCQRVSSPPLLTRHEVEKLPEVLQYIHFCRGSFSKCLGLCFSALSSFLQKATNVKEYI